MANRPQDLISKLADAGEEAIQRVTDIPGAAKLQQSMNATKERLDDLTKKMRGIDAMEKRIERLEKRLDELQGKKRSTTTDVAKTTAGSSRRKASASGSKKKSSSAGSSKKTG